LVLPLLAGSGPLFVERGSALFFCSRRLSHPLFVFIVIGPITTARFTFFRDVGRPPHANVLVADLKRA